MKNAIIKAGNDAAKFIAKNSPLLLTVLGITGMWTGTVMVAKAAPKAKEAVEESRDNRPDDLNKVEEIVEDVKAAAPLYLPAGIVIAGATVCLVGSYSISANRIAKYSGLWIMTEAKAAEYQKKVVEKLGEKKEKEIRDEIVKDHMDKAADDQDRFNMDEALMDGKQLFWDDTTKHYFRCSYQELFDVKERLNLALDLDTSKGCRCISVNDWLYEFDDLKDYCNTVWENYGWYPGDKITYETVPHMCKDGITTCTGIVMRVEPFDPDIR